jgi:hypothetical protein
MRRLLQEFYRKLPIIRELIRIEHCNNHSLTAISNILPSIRRLQIEAVSLSLLSLERYQDPKRLARYEHQVHSQNGEDGIIAEIFRRIGTKDKTFLEIGVGDGSENNIAYLLSQGWTGCWVDAAPEGIRAIRENLGRRLSDGSLKLIELFINMENIDPALESNAIPNDPDLLSIDVDLNTFWIWSALPHIKARVVVVEYNATFPSSVDWKVKYDPAGIWDGTINCGASLKAFEGLGRQFGYCLVGCDLTGLNAYFVRQDLCVGAFLEPFDSETHYEPPRHWLWGSFRTNMGWRKEYGDIK